MSEHSTYCVICDGPHCGKEVDVPNPPWILISESRGPGLALIGDYCSIKCLHDYIHWLADR